MSTPNSHSSGDGTRPVTDGSVDNIGAGKRFDPAAPENSAPAAKEGMSDKRVDRAASRQDDSAPLGMTDSAKSRGNSEPPRTMRENNEQDR